MLLRPKGPQHDDPSANSLTSGYQQPDRSAQPRGPPRTESRINKDFKSLRFSNLKSQNFFKNSKF